jgi:hypothetical protein
LQTLWLALTPADPVQPFITSVEGAREWDIDKLVAIDIHTHAHTPHELADPEELKQREAMRKYFGQKGEELSMTADRGLLPRAQDRLRDFFGGFRKQERVPAFSK